jgi:succinoglycan biosynthesis protein ExoM
LLEELRAQETNGLFTYSVVVVDNDHLRSAEPTVSDFAAESPIAVKYCVEPQQNIALARNKAIENAGGDFIAFIDDDEFPIKRWLLTLFEALNKYGVDGVLGPVMPHFDDQAPQWVVKGKFYDRPSYPTGYRLSWPETRTGNVLFRKTILDGVGLPFKPEFGSGGEDVDFFRRMTERGCTFAWCNEGVAYEVVPLSRCTRRFLLKRALLRGGTSARHPVNRVRNAAKSLIAVPCYTIALPVLAVLGQHLFVRYLVKLCDHIGRLSAFVGLRLVTEREM